MKKIGLIGGISWVSTMDYYKFLNEGINEKLSGLNFAECIIYSLNFGDIQEKTSYKMDDLPNEFNAVFDWKNIVPHCTLFFNFEGNDRELPKLFENSDLIKHPFLLV